MIVLNETQLRKLAGLPAKAISEDAGHDVDIGAIKTLAKTACNKLNEVDVVFEAMIDLIHSSPEYTQTLGYNGFSKEIDETAEWLVSSIDMVDRIEKCAVAAISGSMLRSTEPEPEHDDMEESFSALSEKIKTLKEDEVSQFLKNIYEAGSKDRFRINKEKN